MKNYQELMAQLQSEGKLFPLDAVISAESVQAMNSEMEKVRRDYIRKNAESYMLARRVILTD